jgi:hypothetical protein
MEEKDQKKKQPEFPIWVWALLIAALMALPFLLNWFGLLG